MSISCGCNLWEDEDSTYLEIENAEFSDLVEDEIKCQACGGFSRGEKFWSIPCYKIDEDGNEDYQPNLRYCEKCGDMILSLVSAGFCFGLHTNPIDQWKEYLKEARNGD